VNGAGARSRPIHILQVVAGLHAGGAELLVAELARVAEGAGIRLSVCALDDVDGGPAASRLRDLGIEPVQLGIRGLLNPRDLRRARRHVKAVAPDIVHTHLLYPDIVGGIAARSLGIPAVSTIHSDYVGAGLRDGSKERLAAFARRRCCGRVVAVSTKARRTYLDTGWDSPERVVTVRNGVSVAPQPGAGRSIRQQLGIPPTAPVAMMLSVLRPEKQHLLGIEAVRQLRDRHPDLRLLVAGDGPQRGAIEEAGGGLDGSVLVLGHRDDTMALLDAADLLLHCSSTEAFPTALVEAMAASVPIVATAVGGIPEIVNNGETGVLVEPPGQPKELAAAMATLVDDPALRRHLAAAGRGRYEAELTGEAWAQRLRAVYDSVLAG
jgi:glycosyltransferase involved in cell wall biosynthesis